MEWLRMMNAPEVRLWLAQSMVIFFIVGGTALLAFGVCLLVNSTATLRFIAGMNRWVSFRRQTRALEVPRDTRSVVQKYRYWFAVVFIAGGAFATSGLLMQFNGPAVIKLLGLNAINPRAAIWLADSLRWALVLGNSLAIVAGVMLAFFPERIVALEALGGKWISSRKATKGGDDMHVKLDSWVATQPRPAGWIIVAVGLVMIGTFGMLLPRVL